MGNMGMDIFIKITQLRFFYSFLIVVFIFGATKTRAKYIDSEESQRNVTIPTPALNQSEAKEVCKKYITQSCKTRLPTSISISKSKKTIGKNHAIVGGRLAKPKEYPHMALVGISKTWYCGGSLISENFVLTAAHCASHRERGAMNMVRLGELNLATNGENARTADYQIISIIVHPNYDPNTIDYDIALLKFKGLTSFSDYIRPICLNTIDNIADQNFTAIGWGQTSENGNASEKLRSVDLYPQNDEQCENSYPEFKKNRMLCVGHAHGGKDTCKGDSGGPLQIVNDNPECPEVSIFTQFGITSYGEGCARPNTPAVYTKISHHLPWIESNVWKYDECAASDGSAIHPLYLVSALTFYMAFTPFLE